uniref:Small ribosomal subunit protein uS9c n=1 Tax=Pseudochlorodesmis sp. HV01306c TaxID=2358490 RepID=A0A386AYH0_9CHLO|nr:ribosomal protein S9 [Pseudochlorodesmis sp. HV01306c]
MQYFQYSGIGRRKSAIAQVFVNEKKKKSIALLNTTTPQKAESNLENCEIIVNNKTFLKYFQTDQSAIQKVQKFLKIFGLTLMQKNSFFNKKTEKILLPHKKEKDNITIVIRASGGGMAGQKDAICLALAHAFCQMNSEFYPQLKKQKWLTQDARVKERKKYGLKKARKAPQYSKR